MISCADPGFGGRDGSFKVLGQSAASAEPIECSLHHPPRGSTSKSLMASARTTR